MAIRLATNNAPYPTVVFHGDSFTLGLYATDEPTCWRLLMTDHLQSYGGASVTHRQATSGAKMTTAATVTDAADVVSTYDPDLVFLAYGINDAITSVSDVDFDTATRAVLTEYAGRRVQVQSVPWCNWGIGSEAVYARAIGFNEILADAAADFGQYYVDVWTKTVYDSSLIGRTWQPSTYSPGYAGDNFHYNDAGHARLFHLHSLALSLPGLLSRGAASRDASATRSASGSRTAI